MLKNNEQGKETMKRLDSEDADVRPQNQTVLMEEASTHEFGDGQACSC